MMALNARQAPAQNRAGPPISIDVHTHWTPEAYRKVIAQLGAGGEGEPNPLNFDLDKRRKWMDEHGVQTHVLTRPR
jgi:hypothetical protein